MKNGFFDEQMRVFRIKMQKKLQDLAKLNSHNFFRDKICRKGLLAKLR